MKKLLASLLSVMMVMCFMPAMTWAADALAVIDGEAAVRTQIPDVNLQEAIIEAAKKVDPTKINGDTLAQIKELTVAGKDIQDLDGIQLLTGLEKLDLAGNKLEFISQLDGMADLEKLDLSGNKIRDTGALSRLTSLKNLNLSQNEIQDLGGISGLKKLEILDVSGNLIEDTGALSGLSGLKDLNLSGNKIEDLGGIGGLTGMESLDVSGNLIEDTGALSGLSGLKDLDLSGNKIADLGGIGGLTGLETLDASGNLIEDTGALSGLSGLKELNLSNNKAADLGGISNLTSLTALNVSNNEIQDLGFLTKLTSLETLNLSDNEIEDPTPIQSLTSLTELNIKNNHILDTGLLESVLPDSIKTAAGYETWKNETVTAQAPVVTEPEKPSGGGGYIPPTTQKPVIESDANATVTLSDYGTKATIKVADGYELVDVTVNGVSKGKVDTLTGLKTGDKVVVTTQKIVTVEDEIAAVKATKLVARSANAKSPSGKKAIKVYWFNKDGSELNFDGYEIYRSTKKNSGYGKKPIYTAKKTQYFNTSAKKGTRYYYKVRGYKVIGGETYYTDYSLKAIRTAK